jgi:hypothetical protein
MMLTECEKNVDILQQLLRHCQRASPMLLGFLEVDEDVWECPSDPEQVVSSLTEEFSAEELLASGVVEVHEDGSVKLTASLSGDGRRFIALRDATTGEPFELLARDGCISPSALAVFEILRDGHTQRCLARGNSDLFVAFDMEDLVMCRACGLAATLAVGLDELPLEDVDRFGKSFGLHVFKSDRVEPREETESEHGDQVDCHPDDTMCRFAQTTTDRGRPVESYGAPHAAVQPSSDLAAPTGIELVFLAWKPSELSDAMPCQLKVVVDYLQQLNRFMDVDLYGLGVWEANEETIERLRFIADRRSAAVFREAFLDATDDIRGSMADFGQAKVKSPGPPADYPAAVARLREANGCGRSIQSLGPDQRKRAWRDVQELLDQQVINPIREFALAADDPVERTLLMGIAEISHVFHMHTVLISEELSRRMSESGVERVDPLSDDQVKNLLAMADRLISITKATERCSQLRTTIVQSRAIGSHSIPRLPQYG